MREASNAAARLVRFALVGFSGVGVNLGLVWVALRVLGALEPGAREAIASAVGIAGSVLSNFVLHDGWTWGDREKVPGAGAWLQRFGRFVSVSAVAVSVQFGGAWAARSWLGMDVYVAQMIGVGLGAGINYAANHLWTFRVAGPPP